MLAASNQLRMGLWAIACLLLVATLFSLSFGHGDLLSDPKFLRPPPGSRPPGPEGSSPPIRRLPSFLEIATKYGTDKITTHRYNHMYTKYLQPMRDQPLKMLEIGLGCDMNYGPGKSYYTWLEFFPHVELYYIEYDAECAAKWTDKTMGATIFAGDQSNVTFLEEFIASTGGDFDVIVDDGGHTMRQQIVSFETLFPAVRPGGIYFCEDLQTSYDVNYGGGENMKGTMLETIKGSLDNLILGRPANVGAWTAVAGTDCMREICAFSKKELGVIY